MNSLAIDRPGAASRRSSRSRVDKRRERLIYAFAAVQIVSIVFLQKIGLPIGDSSAELPLLVMAVGLAGLGAAGLLALDTRRAILCAVFASLATAATALNSANLSLTSYLEVLALYIPFMFKIEISARTYASIVEVFQQCMVVICGAVFVQYAAEIALGASKMPSMNVLLPTAWQFPGFTYLRPMEIFHNLSKANGFFMLEVSIVSQFLAIAIIFETIYAQKWWRLAMFVVALLSTFAGSGPLLLVVMAPTLLLRTSPRVLIGITVALVLGILFAAQTQWFTAILSRTDEFSHYNGSAHHRFIEPVSVLLDFLTGSHNFFVGIGAGNIEKSLYAAWWPITKVTVEYGVLTAAAFFAFLGYSMFESPPDWRVALAIFLAYFFLNGSFVVPIDVYLCFLFCALLRIRKEPSRRKSSRRRSRSHSKVAAPISLGTPEGELEPAERSAPKAPAAGLDALGRSGSPA